MKHWVYLCVTSFFLFLLSWDIHGVKNCCVVCACVDIEPFIRFTQCKQAFSRGGPRLREEKKKNRSWHCSVKMNTASFPWRHLFPPKKRVMNQQTSFSLTPYPRPPKKKKENGERQKKGTSATRSTEYKRKNRNTIQQTIKWQKKYLTHDDKKSWSPIDRWSFHFDSETENNKEDPKQEQKTHYKTKQLTRLLVKQRQGSSSHPPKILCATTTVAQRGGIIKPEINKKMIRITVYILVYIYRH